MRSLIIDNDDSFTYNLYQMIAEVSGCLPLVVKNTITLSELNNLHFDNIVISPGPGHPAVAADFGVCEQVIQTYELPILGVCLGHQGLCCAFGGEVIHAPIAMHGRISNIHHNDDTLFFNIPKSFQAVRYHSLMTSKPLPDCLKAIAWSDDGLVMGLRHISLPFWGVQYHPESICSEYGYQLLHNFVYQSLKKQKYFSIHHSQTPRLAMASSRPNYTIQYQKIELTCDAEMVFDQLYASQPNTVWLDSSRLSPGYSRFSFMGCLNGPLSYCIQYDVTTQTLTINKNEQVETITQSIFDFLEQALCQYRVEKINDLPFQFYGGFVGYFGYELKSETAGVCNKHISELPDAQFLFLDRVIVFDHDRQECYLVALTDENNHAEAWFNEVMLLLSPLRGHVDGANDSGHTISMKHEWYFNESKSSYLNKINKCLEYIRDGESYEICLTNKALNNASIDALSYYRRLRKISPAPYSAFMRFNDISIACSSMERFLTIDTDGKVETKPIKGTMRRGSTYEEDQTYINQLQHDEKFRAENLMIVDLLRHDLGRVCEIGSVRVPTLMAVETYQSLHQLVSTVCGKLSLNHTAIDCIKACFPGGSMTGAPKIRTMEIIDQLESEARGIYSGALGYLSVNGAVDLNIVIRTAVITDTQVSVGVGGAIIALSDPEEEYQEMQLKAKTLQ